MTQAPVMAARSQPVADSGFPVEEQPRGWSVTSYRASLAGRPAGLGGP